MGGMRQSQSGTLRTQARQDKQAYKWDGNARNPAGRPKLNFCLRSFTVVSIGIMVSAWFIAKAFVAFAPLTSVWAQYGEPSKLPLLLDATAEELTAGLEKGDFTSVDLVHVSFASSSASNEDMQVQLWLVANIRPGICRTYTPGQLDTPYGG